MNKIQVKIAPILRKVMRIVNFDGSFISIYRFVLNNNA